MAAFVKEYTEVITACGLAGALVFTWLLMWWYHKYREQKASDAKAEHITEILEIRTGYKAVIIEKEAEIIAQKKQIDGLYEGQIKTTGDNMEKMTKALMTVHASTEASTETVKQASEVIKEANIVMASIRRP